MEHRPHIGTFVGPGILVFEAGHWRHVDPDRLTPAERRALRDANPPTIGQDHPLIAITHLDDPLRDTVAP